MYFFIKITMEVKIDQVRYSIEKAREIKEIHRLHYLNSDASEKSLTNLLHLCQCYLGKTITAREHHMQHEGQPMRGFFLAFEDGHYEVVLMGGQNRCWKRLVLCKELFHVILDSDEYRDPLISRLIDNAAISFPDPKSRPDLPIVAEMLAEIAAMEYLFPFEDRKLLRNKMSDGETVDFHAIAKRYGIPQVYVESSLKDKNMDLYSTIFSEE